MFIWTSFGLCLVSSQSAKKRAAGIESDMAWLGANSPGVVAFCWKLAVSWKGSIYSKKSPRGPTEPTRKKPEYLIARFRKVPFNFWWIYGMMESFLPPRPWRGRSGKVIWSLVSPGSASDGSKGCSRKGWVEEESNGFWWSFVFVNPECIFDTPKILFWNRTGHSERSFKK